MFLPDSILACYVLRQQFGDFFFSFFYPKVIYPSNKCWRVKKKASQGM